MSTRRSTRLSSTYRTNVEIDSDEDIENHCLNTPKTKMSSKAFNRKSILTQGTPRIPISKKRQSKITNIDENDEKNVDVSPPKQQRNSQKKTGQTSPLFSPTRLIERLSIEDKDEEEETENESEKSEPIEKLKNFNKYHNASKVLTSGETNSLPGREKEYQELENFLKTHIKNLTSGSLYISGQPGTGKTACLSKILKDEQFSKKLIKVYINCTSISTVGSVFNKIKMQLNIKKEKKSEKENLALIENYMKTNHKHILLVLDEIDQLCSANQSVLYTIFEWPSRPEHRIILIGIANSLDLTDRMLTRLNARCNLKPKLMHFTSYTKQQIVEIFKSRLEEANITDIFPPATIQLLAAKVASVSGDVRRALDIGRRVIEMAERDGKLNMKDLDLNTSESIKNNEKETQPVQLKQVVSVLNNVYGTSQTLNDETESTFPLQQKILLCSLLLILTNSKNKDVTVGRLHDVYKRVCTKRNILAVDQAEFAGLCSLVDTRGIIRLMKKKEPRLSKVILQWDQAEVTDSLKDKQLIASILADASILTGR